jgi:RNA polymerase sigma-70 factor, ECF subfamily
MTDLARPDGQGETERFELVFRAHYAELCDFVHGYVKSRETAADLVHDLFLRLWQLQETETPPPLTRPYLYSAARNRALKHIRHRRLVSRWTEKTMLEKPADQGDTDHHVRSREVTDAIARAVGELPPRCAEIFRMSRYEHLSYKEIAEVLGISVSTVEVQMWRALKALRSSLAPYLAISLCTLLDAFLRKGP